jgi:hypothetical protein
MTMSLIANVKEKGVKVPSRLKNLIIIGFVLVIIQIFWHRLGSITFKEQFSSLHADMVVKIP